MPGGISRSSLDATGIVFSVLCFLHCLAVPLIATGALAWAASEAIHTGLTIALACVVLLVAGPGYRQHRRAVVPFLLLGGLALLIVAVLAGESFGENTETSLTIFGSVVLVIGHILNLWYRKACG